MNNNQNIHLNGKSVERQKSKNEIKKASKLIG